MAGGGTPIAFTPVVTWAGNTITTQAGLYLKTPGLLQLWISFVETVGTAAAVLTVTVPTGYTAATVIAATATQVGSFSRSGATGSIYPMWASPGALTQITSISAGTAGVVDTWSGYFAIPTLT